MSVKDFYNSISTQYDSLRFPDHYSLYIDSLEKKFVLEHCRDGKILEIGAGTGRITAVLADKCRSITAIDFSPDMLNVLRTKVNKKNLLIKEMSLFDLEELEDFGEFDTVVCMRALPHIANVDDALLAIHRSLKAGGNAIFDLWNCYSPYFLLRKALRRGKVFTRFMTPTEMMRVISNGGLQIEDSVGLGYLMPLRRLLGSIDGGRLQGVYSVEKLGHTRVKAFAHSIVFNCIKPFPPGICTEQSTPRQS